MNYEKIYEAAFTYAAIDRNKFKSVVKYWKNKIDVDRTVCEWLYFYVAPKGAKIRKCPVMGVTSNHFFVEWPNGILIDLLLEEYPLDKIDYDKVKNVRVPTSPSDDVKSFAADMGFGDEDLDLDE